MPVDRLLFDPGYLVRLYLEDPGYGAVRQLAGTVPAIAAAWHAQAEVAGALHRAFRERRMAQTAFEAAVDQFEQDSEDGLFHWLPLNAAVQRRIGHVFRAAPATLFLRAADALHLACGAEHGFGRIYSNDGRLLAAAPFFGMEGIDIV